MSNHDTEWKGNAGTAAAKAGAKKGGKVAARWIVGILGFKVIVFGAVGLLVLLAIGAASGAATQQDASASSPSSCGGTQVVVTGTASGLTAEQQSNAQAIASVALSRGLGRPGVLVGIVTALTESTLINVGHGDAAGPSSIGLFQQMPGWGPLSVRTDPKGAAGLFYDALVKLNPPWTTLSVQMQAQAVEQSEFADGSNYAAQLPRGQAITAALMASQPTAAPSAACGAQVTMNGTTVTIPDNQFVNPALRGATITAPTSGMAKGLAVGLAHLGLPYVWGGSDANGGGPDDGCGRGGGALNSCGSTIGFDCSGLTAYVIVNGGYAGPGTSSSAQRNPAHAVPWAKAQAGSIVGFSGHVAIYLTTIGSTRYILEASDVGIPVHVVPLTRTDFDSVVYNYWN